MIKASSLVRAAQYITSVFPLIENQFIPAAVGFAFREMQRSQGRLRPDQRCTSRAHRWGDYSSLFIYLLIAWKWSHLTFSLFCPCNPTFFHVLLVCLWLQDPAIGGTGWLLTPTRLQAAGPIPVGKGQLPPGAWGGGAPAWRPLWFKPHK